MPFGATATTAKPLPNVIPETDRGFTPQRQMPRPDHIDQAFQGPNRTTVVALTTNSSAVGQQSTAEGIDIYRQPAGTWSPKSVTVFNYSNQWVGVGGTRMFVPPYTVMGPLPIRPGYGEMVLRLALPDANYVALTAKNGQFVRALFQEQDVDGPSMAQTFTGP